jgi:hypothetical protein
MRTPHTAPGTYRRIDYSCIYGLAPNVCLRSAIAHTLHVDVCTVAIHDNKTTCKQALWSPRRRAWWCALERRVGRLGRRRRGRSKGCRGGRAAAIDGGGCGCGCATWRPSDTPRLQQLRCPLFDVAKALVVVRQLREITLRARVQGAFACAPPQPTRSASAQRFVATIAREGGRHGGLKR